MLGNVQRKNTTELGWPNTSRKLTHLPALRDILLTLKEQPLRKLYLFIRDVYPIREQASAFLPSTHRKQAQAARMGRLCLNHWTMLPPTSTSIRICSVSLVPLLVNLFIMMQVGKGRG